MTQMRAGRELFDLKPTYGLRLTTASAVQALGR